MSRARILLMAETVARVLPGFGIAVVTQHLLFRGVSSQSVLEQGIILGTVHAVVLVLQSHGLRHVFGRFGPGSAG